MRRTAFRVSYIAVPALAILAIVFVHRQMSGIAPAPPAAVPATSVDPPPVVPTEQQPTVLAPENAMDTSPPASRDTTWSEMTVLPSGYELSLPPADVQPTIRTAETVNLQPPPK